MKEKDYLDVVSDVIKKRGIPTESQVREAIGEHVNEDAFWAMFALCYGGKQRSNNALALHSHDVPRRPIIRGKYEVLPLETEVGFIHDLPELDFLKSRGGNLDIGSIRPIVASYTVLEHLSKIVSTQAAYGVAAQGGIAAFENRFGGALSQTNHQSMLADPVLSQISSANDEGMYKKSDKEGLKVFQLTDNGKKRFLSSLDALFENGFEISQSEIGQTSTIVKTRYQEFVKSLDKAFTLQDGRRRRSLTAKEKREITDRVQHFVETVQNTSRLGIDDSSLESLVMKDYGRARSAVSVPENIRPADAYLVTAGESPYAVTLKKTLYASNIRKIGQGVRSAASALGGSHTQSYLHPIINKIMDVTDNVSTWGPNLDNVTSINRKARLVFYEGLDTLKYLNDKKVSVDGRKRLYSALSFLLERLEDRTHGDFIVATKRAEREDRYKETREVMSQMHSRFKQGNYWTGLKSNNPDRYRWAYAISGSRILRRVVGIFNF